MNPKVKLAAYGVLLILALWFGLAFRSNYATVTKAAAAEPAESATAGTPPPAGTNTEAPSPASTNAATNLTAQATNASGELTNSSGDMTNAPATATNVSATAPAEHPPAAKPSTKPEAAPDVGAARSAMIGYLAGFVLVVIGLGLLITADVTQLVGGQAMDYLFLDVGDAMRDPIYEKAEAEWANGTYLEAIQLLREYLKKNPRELHAALRIAEIYEKDLKNYLASALEYEEVLKQRLPDEKWGWAAIHLCNLYSKLNHQDKTRDLLHRIVNEYPRTAAAKKARVRLGLAELDDEAGTQEAVETSEEVAAPQVRKARDEPKTPPAPEASKPHLPPGFRPKE
jgi:TolA-binding protein